jgi:Pyruvate/2-oxoacid:ferredoxin oxidoreductase gamma subunit
MSYTTKQMLEMSTGFWNKKYGIEIVQKHPGKPGAWVVMVSDSEAIDMHLELQPVVSLFSASSDIFYPTIEKAFAIMEAYLLKKKGGE